MGLIKLHTNQLYRHVRAAIASSTTIYILSSFVMKSGVDLIFDELQLTLNKGADVKILTGDYLYVTQPAALAKLLTLSGNNLEIRLWQSNGIAFHPKSYIFKHEDQGSLVVGSSNLSRSALTTGVEWNIQINQDSLHETFEEAMHHIITFFYGDESISINNESIKIYDKRYHAFHRDNIDIVTTWTRKKEIELMLPMPFAVPVTSRSTTCLSEVYRTEWPIVNKSNRLVQNVYFIGPSLVHSDPNCEPINKLNYRQNE